jgi:hypothetical protein
MASADDAADGADGFTLSGFTVSRQSITGAVVDSRSFREHVGSGDHSRLQSRYDTAEWSSRSLNRFSTGSDATTVLRA